MPQKNSENSPTETAIAVGQLIYTSFQKFGFNLLQSAGTPPILQKSFIDKVVNARWDPHSPPSSDFRAAYIYQVPGDLLCTVFGWLYYDGQDDFGRSGVPYFLAYYWQGPLVSSQLQLCLACLGKGPMHEISRWLQKPEELETLSLNIVLDYEPVRFGVDIPTDIIHKSHQSLLDGVPIDWFVSQTSSTESSQSEIKIYDTPVPEIILPETVEESSDSPTIQLVDTPGPPVSEPAITPAPDPDIPPPENRTATQPALAEMKKITVTLQDFVNKTMGIQGLALISEEGQPICSVMGLKDDSIQMVAGSMLYMTQISRQELEWSTCDWVTVRGPDNYLMLRDFEPGIYLLIKTAKVPMGLLEGVIKRMINKLKEELEGDDVIAISAEGVQDKSPVEPSPQAPPPTSAEVSELLRAVLKNELPSSLVDDDDDDDITYRGRPTSS